jgi:hypothetical protein
MQFSFKTVAGFAAVFASILCQGASGQDAPAKEAQVRDAKGLAPRPGPGDYQAHAQAGAFTIAAEFTEHAISTPEATLSSEDFVAVEVGYFGAPDARLKLSHEDFALRINGKKTLPAVQYGVVFRSLKDPTWEPPAPPEKSKTSIGSGGGGQGGADSNAPPPIVHIPIEVERAMQQRVQKAALPEGERTLPAAGLIFFQYHGKTKDIHNVELTYMGPAGKAVLKLH